MLEMVPRSRSYCIETASYQLTPAETAFECMKTAYDLGVNFFDTAEQYSGGQAERVLGQAIKKFGWKQNDLVISTKVRTTYCIHGGG